MTAAHSALAEALASRLCHDFAGLAGTVAGLLELAEQQPPEEALAMAREASGQLVRRLRVVRAAWGGLAAWPSAGLAAPMADLATRELRIELDAETLRQGRRPACGRLLLNVALVGQELLRGRGTVSFCSETPGLAAVTLSATRQGGPAWCRLQAADTIEPRLFQQAWTAIVAASCGSVIRPAGRILELHLPP